MTQDLEDLVEKKRKEKEQDFDYIVTAKIKHHESILKRDNHTGEIQEVIESRKPNNIPEGKEVFEPDALFHKTYNKSWEYLNEKLNAIEMKAAMSLALRAKANTNSLEPLDDETTIPELIEVLHVSKNRVKSVLAKLWDLGVYGRFDIKEANKPYTKYWILNPYLAFSGKLINSDISHLFRNTKIAIEFRRRTNEDWRNS